MRLILDKEHYNTLSVKYNLGVIQKTAGFKKIIYYNYLINKECFLRRMNNVIETVEIVDGDKKLIKHGDTEMIGDYSEIRFKQFDNFQIPTQLNDVSIIHNMYKIQKNSPITLHITKNKSGLISDIWFDIENNYVGNHMVMEDIDTFLQC